MSNSLDAVKKKFKEMSEYVDPSVNMDDPSEKTLEEQLTLGNNWDDPAALTEALDQHPTYFARWANLYRLAKKKRNYYQQRYDAWEANKKKEIYEVLLEDNKDEGMTAGQAKPTSAQVDNKFKSKFHEDCDDEEYWSFKKPLLKWDEKVEELKIIKQAFEYRQSLLMTQASLLRSLIDNDLIIYTSKRKKKMEAKNHG